MLLFLLYYLKAEPRWSSIALTVAPVLCAFWLSALDLWSERNLLSFAFQHVVSEIFTSWKVFWKFMPASRDLWCLLLTCDRIFTSKHTSGAEEPSERVTTLKTTDLLSTCTNKCMHGSLFFKWERNGPALFCLQLFMSHRSATWVYMNSDKRSRDKEKQTIVKPDIHVPSKPKLPLWLQQDCGVWSQWYSNCNGIRECLNVFVCLGKLLSLYSWVYFPFWVTGKCVFSSLYINSNHSTASLPESFIAYKS